MIDATLQFIQTHIGFGLLLGPLLISLGVVASSIELPRLIKLLAVLFFIGGGIFFLWGQGSQVWQFVQENNSKPQSAMQTLTQKQN